MQILQHTIQRNLKAPKQQNSIEIIENFKALMYVYTKTTLKPLMFLIKFPKTEIKSIETQFENAKTQFENV